jgi:hypothetical protein
MATTARAAAQGSSGAKRRAEATGHLRFGSDDLGGAFDQFRSRGTAVSSRLPRMHFARSATATTSITTASLPNMLAGILALKKDAGGGTISSSSPPLGGCLACKPRGRPAHRDEPPLGCRVGGLTDCLAWTLHSSVMEDDQTLLSTCGRLPKKTVWTPACITFIHRPRTGSIGSFIATVSLNL